MYDDIKVFLAEHGMELIVNYGGQVLYAILSLTLGLWLIAFVTRLLKKPIHKALHESALADFVLRIVSTLLKVVLAITVASMLGVETTSFLAILGSIGLAIGLALQGSLTNFAGGVLILIFKPFKKGNYVKVKNHAGFVHEIDLLHTTLRTRNNQMVVIPNGMISNDVVMNYYYHDKVRKVFYVTVPYQEDTDRALEVILKALQETEVVLDDPAPGVEVAELGEYGVKIRCLAWTIPAKYFGTNEPSFLNIKKALDEAGISIAIPQQKVRLIQESESEMAFN